MQRQRGSQGCSNAGKAPPAYKEAARAAATRAKHRRNSAGQRHGHSSAGQAPPAYNQAAKAAAMRAKHRRRIRNEAATPAAARAEHRRHTSLARQPIAAAVRGRPSATDVKRGSQGCERVSRHIVDKAKAA